MLTEQLPQKALAAAVTPHPAPGQVEDPSSTSPSGCFSGRPPHHRCYPLAACNRSMIAHCASVIDEDGENAHAVSVSNDSPQLPGCHRHQHDQLASDP